MRAARGSFTLARFLFGICAPLRLCVKTEGCEDAGGVRRKAQGVRREYVSEGQRHAGCKSGLTGHEHEQQAIDQYT